MKQRIVAFAVLSSLSGCFGLNTGVHTTTERRVASFHGVHVGSAVQATITRGATPSVVLSGDEGVLQHLRTDVGPDGQLRIELEVGALNVGADVVHATITADASVDEVGASGAAVVDVDALKADEVRLSAAGSGVLRVASLEATALQLEASGSSFIDANGRVTRATLWVSGSSEVDTLGVQTGEVAVDISGASTVRLSASTQVTGTVRGSSTLNIAGMPSVSVATEGASTVANR